MRDRRLIRRPDLWKKRVLGQQTWLEIEWGALSASAYNVLIRLPFYKLGRTTVTNCSETAVHRQYICYALIDYLGQ